MLAGGYGMGGMAPYNMGNQPPMFGMPPQMMQMPPGQMSMPPPGHMQMMQHYQQQNTIAAPAPGSNDHSLQQTQQDYTQNNTSEGDNNNYNYSG
jgi:hypothetical protein